MRHLWCLLSFVLACAGPCLAEAAAADGAVRVGLTWVARAAACEITSEEPFSLHDARGRPVAKFPAGAVLRIAAAGGRLEAACRRPEGRGRAEAYVVSSTAPLHISAEGRGERTYRGRLALSAAAEGLRVVNEVHLEDYLRGVLPAEVPPSFAPEALRAQAIVARTYAVATAGRHRAEGYDLCDTWHCQVYRGAGSEDPRLSAAADETAGLIATFQGEPIQAVYHSACGGRTAANETAWPGGSPLPYLRGVSDCGGESPWCAEAPGAAWTRRLSHERLAQALACFGVVAPITALMPGDREEAGRPREYLVQCAAGERLIAAADMRAALNGGPAGDAAPSADFEVTLEEDAVVLHGRGAGHGVGLCQWGANARARAGWTAEEILAHYYSGVTVEPLAR